MNFREYEDAAASTDHSPKNITYYTLGLCGESGEFADKVKKVLRDSDGVMSAEAHSALVLELGDVLWYAARLANKLGVSMATVAARNMQKLADRKERGVLRGSGDAR